MDDADARKSKHPTIRRSSASSVRADATIPIGAVAMAISSPPSVGSAESRSPSAEPTSPAGRTHLYFVDNIRWVMILLVLSMHAADTYSPFGNWYYRDEAPVGLTTAIGFWTYQAVLQAFFMGLLFFVAGYFVPGAYDRKGARRFMLDRRKTAGLPTMFYIFILGPLTEYYISRSWRPVPRISFLHEWDDLYRSDAVSRRNRSDVVLRRTADLLGACMP